MTDTNLKYDIDGIFYDFLIYQDPGLLKEEFSKLIDQESADMKGIKKYFRLFSNIDYSWKKTLRYEVYFEKFYVADNSIESFEALNHHIHAYLQDMDTLKNKINILFGNLKKDISNIASNRKDVIEFTDEGIKKNFEVFDGILKYRIQHVHNGARFIDEDLLKSEISDLGLKAFGRGVFDPILDIQQKPELMTKFQKNKEETFNMAKNRWVKTAQENAIQVTGWIESLIKITRPKLYQFLNIQSVHDLISDSSKISN